MTNTISDVIVIIRGIIKDLQKNDGRISFEYIGDSTFNIPHSFINSTSLKVYQNGTEISETDFIYNSDTNQVTIDFQNSGDVLTNGDIIIITYSYYQKYSDEELEGYIKSSLAYFTQFNYKKIFEVENDEIVANNDLKPTIQEVYFISLVASILIDPQNIEINTPEFKLTSNRSKSDQDQIKDAFEFFSRNLGEISFEKIDVNFRNK